MQEIFEECIAQCKELRYDAGEPYCPHERCTRSCEACKWCKADKYAPRAAICADPEDSKIGGDRIIDLDELDHCFIFCERWIDKTETENKHERQRLHLPLAQAGAG